MPFAKHKPGAAFSLLALINSTLLFNTSTSGANPWVITAHVAPVNAQTVRRGSSALESVARRIFPQHPNKRANTVFLSVILEVPASQNVVEEGREAIISWFQAMKTIDNSLLLYGYEKGEIETAIKDPTKLPGSITQMRRYCNGFTPKVAEEKYTYQ